MPPPIACTAAEFEPYQACAVVCGSDPPLCLYRGPVADLVGRRPSSRRLAAGRHRRRAVRGQDQAETWNVCQDAAYDLVEFPDSEIPAAASSVLDKTARRVCLCFEQQMLAADQLKVPRTSRRILAGARRGGF